MDREQVPWLFLRRQTTWTPFRMKPSEEPAQDGVVSDGELPRHPKARKRRV